MEPNENEKEEEQRVVEGENAPLHLFKMKRSRTKWWDDIMLIAPTAEKKKWESKDAVGAWCLKCKEKIRFKVQDVNGVKRHIEKKHPHLLTTLKTEDSKEGSKKRLKKTTLETVIFDVGGTKYKVSRSLLSNHPNTMLARSASNQRKEDPESDIFIERDGERFKYCLDYLRDGRVILPTTVPKAAVMMDLKYIGVENVEEDAIETYGAEYLKELHTFNKTFDDMRCIAEDVLANFRENGWRSKDDGDLLQHRNDRVKRAETYKKTHS